MDTQIKGGSIWQNFLNGASGFVGTRGVLVNFIILTGGVAASSVILKNGLSSAGETVFTLKVGAEETKVFVFERSFVFPTGLYLSLADANISVLVGYHDLFDCEVKV